MRGLDRFHFRLIPFLCAITPLQISWGAFVGCNFTPFSITKIHRVSISPQSIIVSRSESSGVSNGQTQTDYDGDGVGSKATIQGGLFPEELNIIFDSKCSVCQMEVDFLQKRMNKLRLSNIRFTDLESGQYDDADPVNGGITYETGMRAFHAVKADGTILSGVPVFREAYDLVDLGWLWEWTKEQPDGRMSIWAQMAKTGYNIFARFRTNLTRGASVEELIESRDKLEQLKAAGAEGNGEACIPCNEKIITENP